MRITHGPSPAPTNAWVVFGAQWTRSHARNCRSSPSTISRHSPLEHEEVLLIRFAVVHRARLARLEHVEPDAELRMLLHVELGSLAGEAAVGLEVAARAEDVVAHPADVRGVDDEPAVVLRDEAGAGVDEARLLRHAGSSRRRARSGAAGRRTTRIQRRDRRERRVARRAAPEQLAAALRHRSGTSASNPRTSAGRRRSPGRTRPSRRAPCGALAGQSGLAHVERLASPTCSSAAYRPLPAYGA